MSISGAIEKGIADAFDRNGGRLVNIVLDSLWRHPAYPAIVGGQLRLMETGMAAREAWDMSRECLAAFLQVEKIEVGDPRFDWSPDAGRVLVEEFEIDHWESKP